MHVYIQCMYVYTYIYIYVEMGIQMYKYIDSVQA